MSIRVHGINHPALLGLRYEETVDFYTRVLGMRLVLEQPNLDDPSSVHLFFEAGPGQFIAYFVPKPGTPVAPHMQPRGPMHLALNLRGSLQGTMAALEAEGVPYSGPIDRGYERSSYFHDPNGIVLELLTWIHPLPPEADEGDATLAAQARRKARGAYAIEAEDVEAVLEEGNVSAP